MNRLRILLSTLAILFAGFAIHAQTTNEISRILRDTDVPALTALSTALSERFTRSHEEALRQAAVRGWVVKATLPSGQMIELMELDDHGNPLYYATENLVAAQTVSTNKVWSGGGLGLSLSGSGLVLREWDGGAVRGTHQELTGRVTQVDGATTQSDHSTHVAGTMIASGVQSAAKGMSHQATLRAFEWTNDLSEMTSEATAGALLSNHSYGYICGWYYNGVSWSWYGDSGVSPTQDYKFGFYSDNCESLDEIAFNAPYYLICKSSGNDRGDYNGSGPQEMDGGADGFDCVGDMGNAKNILTVGAVGDIPGGYVNPASVVMSTFSGWGPTDDGRIKPDIVANGIGLYSCFKTNNTAYGSYSGTSMATPNACGSLMLLQQHHNTLHAAYMKSATLKALVIHTADEAGASNGPDYAYGWGLLNTSKAAQVISQKNVISRMDELTLNNGSTYSVNVNCAGTEPLRVTICWTDRKATSPTPSLNPTTIMLVHDLDLRVDGTVQPWILNPASPSSAATTGDNIRDNVEQVYIATPTAGTHTITVTHKGTLTGGSQNFSMIVTGIYVGVADPNPFTATTYNDARIDLAWTKNQANNNVMAAWSSTGTFGIPVNGTTYSAGNSITGGGTVLYVGPLTTFQHTGLTANTNYYYKIWSVDGTNQYSYGKTANASTLCMLYNSFPITENFNASTLPSCWSQQPSGATNDWSVSNTNLAGGSAYELKATYQSVNPGVTRLKTFFFNTVGLTSLNLSFRHLLDDYGVGATLRVQSSADGVTWTNEAWSMATSGNTNKGPFLVNTTIANNLNSPFTMIAFVVEGNLFQYDYWYIDNVSITAPGYWVGGTTSFLTDWNTATNWGDGVVPTSSTNVIIPQRTYMPVITNDPATPARANNLYIMKDATITISPGKALEVSGNLTLEGTIAK